MRLSHYILVLLLLLSGHSGTAQQPAHFILGEDQFRGIQIYDVIQDQESNFWIATDEGLYMYDYHSIRKVECDESKSNAVFGFVINQEGTIYCHNLNNQVFQIKQKRFKLFHEINSEESSSDMSLSVGDDENLLIGTNRIIVLDKQGKIIQKSQKITGYIGQPFNAGRNKTIYPIQGSDSILIYSRQKFNKQKLNVTGNEKAQSLRFFRLNNQDYAINLFLSQTYLFDTKSFSLAPTENLPFKANRSTRLYSTGDVVWAADLLQGVHLIESPQKKFKVSNLYQNYYISNAFRDKEGNYLLSTFDKGILVIRDLLVPEVIQSFRDDPITALYSDNSIGLLMGSSKGKVFTFQNSGEHPINLQGKRSIDKIYGSEFSDLIIFDDGRTKAYHKKTHQKIEIFERSLKDVAFVTAKDFYIGTNTGIYKCELQPDHSIGYLALSNTYSRIYSLAYNEEEKCLYAATSSGLISVDKKGEVQKIEFNKEGIYPTSRLYYQKGKVYAGERKNGILIIARNKIVQAINPVVNGQKEIVSKIFIKDSSIFAKTSSGFYQFDMNGNMTKSIQNVFGFSNKRVIDFTFHKDMLWVSHSGGLQQIDLKYYHANLHNPACHITKIYVNDTPRKVSDHLQLTSRERKISFALTSPTLRNRESIRYHYRLLGYDDKWQSNNFDANIITYNALSHGDYTFQVKAENQGKFSPMISYTFSIAQPFYSQWWFIAGVMILFVVIVLFIYRWKLKQQRIKNEQITELNTSKLTAIKSQMNPHFIFNSLNSIQDLILKGDVENSYSYITTFSNLVRSTLNHSEQEFIDFEQEIKLLELYLSLEKLRFKKNLNYSIESKNVEDIMVPPLIIQPFIENALVHGLLHKEGSKELKISFEAKDNLICIIEDNGIGRERAKSIKKRQRSEHESFSGKAIRKRFEILSKIFEGKFGFEYEDLFHEGIPSGTKVILTIPIKHKF